MKKVAGTLKLDQAQYRELEAFSKFGSDLDPATQRVLDKGARNTEMLKQRQYNPMRVENQIALLYCGVNDLLHELPLKLVADFEHTFLDLLQLEYGNILKELRSGSLSEETAQRLEKIVAEVVQSLKKQ